MSSGKGGADAVTVSGVTGRGTAGANLLALRSHNTALVLDLLRGAGAEGISRLELAERTGLTPQAVSKITARLRRQGLAAEAGRRASTGGKPRTVLRLVPEAGHAVGAHIDRDELRVVVVDLNGTVIGERRRPLDLGAGAESVVTTVAREVEGLVGELLGAGVPGAGVAQGGSSQAGVDWAGVAQGGSSQAGVDRAGSSQAGVDWAGSSSAGVAQGGTAQAGVDRAGSSQAGVDRAGSSQAGVDWAGSSSAGVAQGGTALAGVAEAGGAGAAGARIGAAPAGVTQVEGARPVLADVGPLVGVGVALPGPLDHRCGVLHRVTGFPEWDGFPLRDALARRLGVPVVVDKDTNAAALGLAVAGEGRSFAYLHLGTGLGAGLVIGGSVHRGARTGAGEFGHQVIQLDGPLCGCGDRGCVEALCLAAVERGEIAEAARVLGAGAANLVGLLDIELVLLGGRTVAAAPEVFVAGVAEVLAARARREGAPGDAVPVRIAPGGESGVAEGAAQLLLAPMFGRGDG
ncbi:ROK family protein [Streptomyces sp. NPDC001292]|uniref:ROK family transcriptional regulator n=1 Tax=Streptomyces sp. NPDC001292 TaxID=3364558 RepID=UPI003687C20B